ncbi:hypothetical protein [uncultured Thiobacillus sp.]|uniref:hypothetical protein n=1 Tax=uncultured Thiobacillus sp. TaxID=189996 RepID=UPI00261673EA|nr:hypothetical protein [uncultured Thiobacillus sp.]
MMSQEKIKADEGRDMPEKRVQGKRLLITIFCLPGFLIIGGIVAIALFGLWVRLRYGVNDAFQWSGRPRVLDQYPYLIYLLAGLSLFLIGAAGLLWRKIFFSSGYISPHTQQQLSQGIWPIIGGYWKPAGYVVYIVVLSYGAYLGYEQEGLWALALTLAFVFWLIYLAWIDLRNFRSRRRPRIGNTRQGDNE